MPKKAEDTPFVIDFKPQKSNYGTATDANDAGANSSQNNNNNNNNNSAGDRDVGRTLSPTPSAIYCLHGQTRIEVRDHCHRSRSEGMDLKARKKLIIASCLCLFFMVCEIIGGVLSNSLAIATDAAHLLTDFASFMISLFAIWIAGRPSTQRMSFGWYRAEVIGALASVVMIWFITAILVWIAIERIIKQDFELNAMIMLITSGLAILVNVIMGVQLQHGHSHGGGTPNNVVKQNQQQQPQCAPPKGSKNKKLEVIKPPPSPTKVAATTDGDAKTATSEASLSDGIPDSSSSGFFYPAKSELPVAEAQTTPVGLQTYSYQNATNANEARNEMAAVMAETTPGAHSHGGSHGKDAVNINVRAAFIHVLGDAVQSVGVFLAALLIYFRPDWAIADPICTFIFSIIVLITTFSIMKDALLVLMEGTPSYMHYAEVLHIFEQINGVERVHNLRIWALSINKIALSVHLAVAPGVNPKVILQEATTAVHLRYNFFETTIQIEDFTPDMENCQQCVIPIK